jgi:hypothetical protein
LISTRASGKASRIRRSISAAGIAMGLFLFS